jgi:NADH-quinone oxidoreductase subunit J
VTIALYLLLGALVVGALWTVQASIMRAAIGLAVVSVILTILMFQMGAPLAGVFELSVCAGLITVVFVSVVSMTASLDEEAEKARAPVRARRLRPAIIAAACVGALLWVGGYALDATPAISTAAEDVREVLWGARSLDLLGQIIMIFVGVFGVVVLFKERKGREARR